MSADFPTITAIDNESSVSTSVVSKTVNSAVIIVCTSGNVYMGLTNAVTISAGFKLPVNVPLQIKAKNLYFISDATGGKIEMLKVQ